MHLATMTDILGYSPVYIDNLQHDADFRAIVSGGWANESDGNVESPVGHFARISIAYNELNELRDACDLAPLVMQVNPLDGSIAYGGFGWVGHFIVVENYMGLVWVYALRTEADCIRVMERLSADYQAWDAGDANED